MRTYKFVIMEVASISNLCNHEGQYTTTTPNVMLA